MLPKPEVRLGCGLNWGSYWTGFGRTPWVVWLSTGLNGTHKDVALLGLGGLGGLGLRVNWVNWENVTGGSGRVQLVELIVVGLVLNRVPFCHSVRVEENLFI